LLPDKLFAPFEIALQEFHLSGGNSVSSIRAPWSVYLQFLRAFPNGGDRPYYIGTPVEFTRTQSAVSIRGKSARGEAFEFPTPQAQPPTVGHRNG